MLIPLVVGLVLIALIMATAKIFKVSSKLPLAIAIGMYGVFVLAALGVIPVAKEQFQMILSKVPTAIAIYAAVAAVIFFQAFMWIKHNSSR
jgi:hypothetical protein